jgi:Zn-dependent alcohol dehydrogenase
MAEEFDAVVCYEPNPGPNWKVEKLTLSRSPGPRELKVRMVATGICHTDLILSSIPGAMMGFNYPKIFGHEGAGIVEEVGPGVTAAKVGDPVLLSYDYCKECDLCSVEEESYCLNFGVLNVLGDQTFVAGGKEAGGKFFGQSSFAGISIVSETSVVNVKDSIKSDDELKLLAPLGCGLMTGSGTVLNHLKARPFDVIVVTGLGAVGLGAVMGANLAGCKEIIAVDRVVSRLDVAKELGATKVLESKPNTNMVEELQKLANGQRISAVIETTGVISVIEATALALGKHGRLIQLGVPTPGLDLKVQMTDFFANNKTFESRYLGDTTAQRWIPQMLGWWREGKFPIEKIVQQFPVKDALLAVQRMKDGTVIKPVLIW